MCSRSLTQGKQTTLELGLPVPAQNQRNMIPQSNNIPLFIKNNNLSIIPPILNNLRRYSNPQPLFALLW